MSRGPTVIVGLVVSALAACAGGAPAPITARYHCDEGTGFVAVFDRAAGSATATFAGAPPRTLPLAISGSGFRYSDDKHELRGKGDEGLWIVDGAVKLHCRAQTE